MPGLPGGVELAGGADDGRAEVGSDAAALWPRGVWIKRLLPVPKALASPGLDQRGVSLHAALVLPRTALYSRHCRLAAIPRGCLPAGESSAGAIPMSVAASVNQPPEPHVRVLGGQGWVGLVGHLGSEVTAVNAARVSFGKRKDVMDERDVALLDYLLDHRHTSPLEHVVFTFIVHCPLFVRSQWHRHRTWSYNEISRRYTEFDLEFYVPPQLRRQAENDRQASVADPGLADGPWWERIRAHHAAALALYHELLAAGVCREQARGVLPQNLMTTFWATVDLANLIHFLELRSHPGAQWEIQEYARAIRQLIEPIIPHLARRLPAAE